MDVFWRFASPVIVSHPASTHTLQCTPNQVADVANVDRREGRYARCSLTCEEWSQWFYPSRRRTYPKQGVDRTQLTGTSVAAAVRSRQPI